MVLKYLAGLSCLLAGTLAPSIAMAEPLLIGSFTGGAKTDGQKGIYLYDFDTQTGHITPTPVQVTQAGNPSWLTLSADRRFLYAVNENGPGEADEVSRVSAYRLDKASGRLTFLNRTLSLGGGPTHSSLSADGRYLFVANYSPPADPGGTLAVIPVKPDGTLAPVTQIKTHRASMVDKERQLSPHVHSAISSPDGRFLFAQDLGADRIYVYSYDPAHAEAPLSALKDQPFLELPPGSGPRHLLFAPDGRHAWLTLEMTGQIAVLDHRDGHLTVKQVLPLAAPDFHGQLGAGALHLSPDGRFLLVTDRGTDNQLVSFAVDPASGALTFASRRSVEGETPREFAIAPSGRFVVVGNQGSNRLEVFRRDPASGVVGDKIQSIAVSQPSDVKFVG